LIGRGVPNGMGDAGNRKGGAGKARRDHADSGVVTDWKRRRERKRYGQLTSTRRGEWWWGKGTAKRCSSEQRAGVASRSSEQQQRDGVTGVGGR